MEIIFSGRKEVKLIKPQVAREILAKEMRLPRSRTFYDTLVLLVGANQDFPLNLLDVYFGGKEIFLLHVLPFGAAQEFKIVKE